MLTTQMQAELACLQQELSGMLGPVYGRFYLVGGWVRDLLLGVASNDIDGVVVKTSAAELVALGFVAIDPTSSAPVYVKRHAELGKVEVALPRREVKVAAGYRGFTYIPDPELPIEADLERRDFRCNALALHLASGALIDPLGGYADLAGKRLAPCSARAFVEDPLRLFRALRFTAAGWQFSPELEALIVATDWRAELAALPVERKWAELVKALEKPAPWRFFEELVRLKLDSEVFAALLAMPTIPAGPAELRPDLLRHGVEVLDFVARRTTDPLARLAAFLHDIGKLATLDPAAGKNRHLGHEQAGEKIAGELLRKLKAPGVVKQAVTATCRLHGKAGRWAELRPASKVALARSAAAAGIAEFLPLIAAANGHPAMHGWGVAVKAATANSEQLAAATRFNPQLFAGCSACAPCTPDCRRQRRQAKGKPAQISLKERQNVLHQHRVELFRAWLREGGSEP